jgi:lysophospholipase L1-like esterase
LNFNAIQEHIMKTPDVPCHAWRACLLAAATVSASSAEAQVANSHVARSWVGTWGAAPAAGNDRNWPMLRRQAARDLLAQQTDRLVGSRPAAGAADSASDSQRRLRDVLATAGVRPVIVLFGIGDLGMPGGPGASPDPAAGIAQLIAAYRQLIARARARGLPIYGGTMTPFAGATKPGCDSADKETVRQGANDWIRNSGEFDAVIDFDCALRDPRQPARMLPAFDSGDHLHPNEAGLQAMACAIPLAVFAIAGQVHPQRAMPSSGTAAHATSGCAPLRPPGAA